MKRSNMYEKAKDKLKEDLKAIDVEIIKGIEIVGNIPLKNIIIIVYFNNFVTTYQSATDNDISISDAYSGAILKLSELDNIKEHCETVAKNIIKWELDNGK